MGRNILAVKIVVDGRDRAKPGILFNVKSGQKIDIILGNANETKGKNTTWPVFLRKIRA